MVKVVPIFILVSNSIVPPKDLIILLIIDKPNPIPLDLVVNLGSNIFNLISSSIPDPLSLILIIACVVVFEVCLQFWLNFPNLIHVRYFV